MNKTIVTFAALLLTACADPSGSTPALQSSAYNPSYADSRLPQAISYTAPINLTPEEQQMVEKNKTLLQVGNPRVSSTQPQVQQ